MSASNYYMDSPINRKVYVPGESEIPFAPVSVPKNAAETDQTYRHMTWLMHKPQDHAVFPVQPTAVKIEKKK
jgi:hypothetical protein